MAEAWQSQRECVGLPTCQEKALGTWQGQSRGVKVYGVSFPGHKFRRI